MRSFIIGLSLLVATPVLAQQTAADPLVFQRILNTAIAQRNQMNNAALQEAAIAAGTIEKLTDDLAKAQARIKELEVKPDVKKD